MKPTVGVLSALTAFALGSAVVLAPSLYAFILPVVFSVGVLVLVLRWNRTGEGMDAEVAAWTFGSYALHLGLSLAIGPSRLTALFFGTDADTYHSTALAIVRHWSEGTPMPELLVGKEGFYHGLARLYEIVGPHRHAGLAVTSLCGALLVPLVFDTTRRLFGGSAARAVLPLVVLLPGLLVWTSQLLKEAPILAALALGSNLAVRLAERVSPSRLAVLGLTVAVLFTLRANIAYVFGAGILVGLALGARHVVAGAATAAAMVALLAVIVLVGGLGESGYQFTANANLDQVNTVRADLASTATSGVGHGVDVSTTAGSLAYLPIGLPQFLLGPFPWQVRNLRQTFGLVEAMTLWLLVPSFLRGLRRARRHAGRKAAVLLAPAAMISVVLALLLGNFGTLVRERIQVVILLIPFVALGRLRREDEAAGIASAGSVVEEPLVSSVATSA